MYMGPNMNMKQRTEVMPRVHRCDRKVNGEFIDKEITRGKNTVLEKT